MSPGSRIRRMLQWAALPVAMIVLALAGSHDELPVETASGLVARVEEPRGAKPNGPIEQSVPAAVDAPGRRGVPHTSSGARAPGMVAAIDPETGVLGAPTPEQLRDLDAGAANASGPPAQDPVEIRGRDGSYGLDLRGSAQDYATVRVERDGRLLFNCVQTDSVAASILSDSTTSPPLPEEE